MLKKFFFNFLSSFIGAWVALGLFCVCLVIVVVSLVGKAGLSSAGRDVEKISGNTVLTIDLEGAIEERAGAPDFNPISLVQGNIDVPQDLQTLVAAIKEAADNKDVRMIYLKCKGVGAGPATLHSLRDALLDFKKSGKKIYAYGDGMVLGDYYLATTADSLFLNPAGALSINGMGTSSLYMKELLEKVGIEMQVVKVGTFKSAVEPYINTEMSGPARAQLDTLYGNLWDIVTSEICQSRKMSRDNFISLINDSVVMLQPASFAEIHKLVDKTVYERTMDDRIATQLGVEKKKINFVSPTTLAAMHEFGNLYSSSRQIAVLYAVGEIRDGAGKGIDCEMLVPEITRLADEDDVKGLILRVNSPGGSVFGSDLIGEALNYFKSKGKPFIVSMGDMAASGGYWISCQADRIFADPMTITGSIGIFGMIPNAAGLAKKVGVNPQFVSTNPDVDFPSLLKPMTPSQLASMQGMVNRGYDQFVGRVSKGRKLSDSRVRQIAEGRIWDGRKALELKLVDELGDLGAAIDWMNSKLKEKGEKDCDVAFYPLQDDNFWTMMRQLSMQNMKSELRNALIREVREIVPESEYADEIEAILSRRPVQARMMPLNVKM